MGAHTARLSADLIAAIAQIDDGELGIAEIWRRVGATADQLGECRPCYEEIRLRVHAIRADRREDASTAPTLADIAKVAWEVAQQRRPPQALIDRLGGRELPPLRR